MLPVFKQEYLSSSIQELTGNTFFETPLEEFELQLMHAESRLSQDSIVSPERPSCNITVRKGKKQHVTFEDQAEYTGYQSKDTVEMGSQTDAFPINFSSHSTDTLQSNFNETPPRVLRERIKHYQKEYDELRDFTVLEKQIYNVGSYKELNQLETENRHLQKSIGDLEAMILDVNCTNSKLSGENKSLKERLEKESEKCNDLTGHFQTLHETEAALSERSQEMVTLKKQLNMANQRIKHLENEKNDFDMIRELAEGNLKRRNEELTHSLEDALMKLKELHQSGSNVLTDDMNKHIQTSKEEDDHVAELKHNSEELTGISTCTVDLNKLQDEMKVLREENSMYIQELKEKNTYLEQLKQENEQLKVNDLSAHLDSAKEELNSLQEINLLYVGQLKEKDEHLEMLTKLIEELNSEKAESVKDIHDSKENNVCQVEQNGNFAEIGTCTSDFVAQEDDSVYGGHRAYVEQLVEKDNYLEIAKQSIEDQDSVKDADLKDVEQLQDEIRCLELLKMDNEQLKEQNLLYIEQLKEKDRSLEILKHQIEDLNSVKIANLKYVDELEEIDFTGHKEIISLEEDNSMCIEKPKERDDYLKMLTRQIDGSDPVKKYNFNYNEQLQKKEKCPEVMLQQNELQGTNTEGLSGVQDDTKSEEGDNSLHTLTQQTRDSDSAKEANFKCFEQLQDTCLGQLTQEFEELKGSLLNTQEMSSIRDEVKSVVENNLTGNEQLKVKDECLELPEKKIDQNIELSITERKRNEENLFHAEQSREISNHNEMLKHHIEDLDCMKVAHIKCINELKEKIISLHKEINMLKDENSVYIKQLREKDDYLQVLTQQIEELNSTRESDLKCSDEFKENNIKQQDEIVFLKEEISSYLEQLKERDNHFQTLKQQIEDMNSVKEFNLKCIDELNLNNIRLQEKINCLNEENSMYKEQIMEKDNNLETLHQQISAIGFVKEANIKQINELKDFNVSVQEEMYSMKNENSTYIKQLKEKDNNLEAQKQQIEDLNSVKEDNLKSVDELRKSNVGMQEEIDSLKKEISMYSEQLAEKDNYIETLKQELKALDNVKEINIKYTDDLKQNYVNVQDEIMSLKEENSTYIKQLKEKDNNLEAHKQQIEDLNSVKEDNLKSVDELRKSNVGMQEEIDSLKKEISMYSEQLAEKDNYLETLKQELKALDNVKEINIKYTDDLKQNYVNVQDEIMSLKEENSAFIKQLKEKDNYFQTLKQQIEDLVSVKEANLKYIQQLEKDKYAEVFRTDNNERSYDNGVFTAEVDHCRKELPAESSVIDKSISDMSYEIASCRRAILKEIRCLKPNYDVESVSQVCLTKLLKILLKVVMEKEEEVLHVFQVQMDEVCAKASDYEREYADKDRRKDCWVRELETEVERLQAELTRIEEENKALKMDDHLDYIKILEQEKADLIKTVRQSDSDLAIVQIEVNSMNEKMKSCDKDVAKKMEDLEFLVEEKDSLICQLKEELESQLKKQADVAVLRKEIFGLEESNAVLNEKLEKRNNDSSLLLEKLEELQCAVLSEKNKTQDVMAKLGSLETELKSLSRKNCDLIEEMNANKEVHSILLKEKECSSEMTLNLKRVTEDLATKQDELNSERNLRCQLEKDVAIVVKMREESGQLQMLQLEDGLQKQKELAMKNENLAVYITELKDEVKKLRDENVSLRASFETLVAEKDGINSEIDDLKKQLVMCLQEKASLAADFVRLQKYVQQQQDALRNENRSSIDETDNCAQNLHSESQSLSARLADGMAHENSETELKKLKEKLEICMKEKLALDDENELLVTRIRGLENMLETYCVINNGLEKSKGVLEEDKRRLLSELSDSHRRLSDAESEIRELKLKSPALKDGSVSQENSILHCSVKELQTENESLRNRNELLFQKNQSANQNIAALHAQYRQLETHLAQRTHVAKLSVATNTDISGSCQCKELGKQVQELKVINAERNNRIGILELQVKAEDFPHRQKVKELQDSLSFYQSKNMELKTDLRRLHKILKHSEQICDSCRKRNSVKPKHVAIQTDEVKDEDFSMAGGGGSGIIREDQLMKMRIRIRELESKNEMLKELCRSRRQRILELEEMLEVHLRSRDKKKEHVSELRDVQVVERPSNRADSLRDAGQVQRSQEFGSGPVNVAAGNKENFLESHKALMRQRRNMYSKNYKPDVRRPLNENISGIQDSDISFED
ncbi:hypothetical protein L798_06285 [Zootermopsis nevadensis]|uniref:Uncharacterized protein n=2 Tax=Zootermopsis nevadensis TaxID=136037 RepID=A0A067R748_ZOONE|nr:hypothetical protein L798_06285 [Zootermopsis nevadensis]